ncbi:nitrogen fixation protein NifZ, partial [Adlercreutzia sp. DFI.6.23]|uniref:nitrogen fixation protein NifZ n=1 Tax=Adlercreutzia sp. DFI.6.23 TaxID=2963705 RepID=UPI00210B51AD
IGRDGFATAVQESVVIDKSLLIADVRKIGYPEVHFDTLDIELGAGAFTVAVRPQGAGAVDEAVAERVTAARNLRNDGTFAEAVRVELPCAESWNAQRDAAWEAWATEHPEVLEEPDTDEEAPSGDVADEAAEPAPVKAPAPSSISKVSKCTSG